MQLSQNRQDTVQERCCRVAYHGENSGFQIHSVNLGGSQKLFGLELK